MSVRGKPLVAEMALPPPPRTVQLTPAYFRGLRWAHISCGLATLLAVSLASVHLSGYRQLLKNGRQAVVTIQSVSAKVRKGNTTYVGHFFIPDDPTHTLYELQVPDEMAGYATSITYNPHHFDQFVEGAPSLERFEWFIAMWAGIISFLALFWYAVVSAIASSTMALVRKYEEWEFEPAAPIVKVDLHQSGKATVVTVWVKVPVPGEPLRRYPGQTSSYHLGDTVPVLFESRARATEAVVVKPHPYFEVIGGDSTPGR